MKLRWFRKGIAAPKEISALNVPLGHEDPKDGPEAYREDTLRGGFLNEEELIELLESLGKFVIAKKTLAAGSIPPEKALSHIASLKCVDSVAIGVASEREAEETMSLAKKLLA